MKALINNEFVELTPEEEAEWLKEVEELKAQIPPKKPTQQERIDALESALLALLGGSL